MPNRKIIVVVLANLVWLPAFAQGQQTTIEGYTIAWSDDFDGDSLDTGKWTAADTNRPTNNSRQDYLPSQVAVSDGKLIIKSENVPSRGLPFRSGLVTSVSEQRYGRWEVRAKLPGTKGMWPAIWLLPDTKKHRWPSQGEIDIMENRGNEPTMTSSAFHYGTNPPYSHKFVTQNQPTSKQGSVDYHAGFHVYACEWDPQEIRFYVDGEKHYTVTNDMTGGFLDRQTAPMQLVINTAVGGDFLDNPDDSTVWPQTFEIDYVRVWEKAEAEGKTQGK
jgi:beta-glucanase (GH16 family)